jgi:glycosyltransferase involved in cell wall biosynthesis
MPTAADFPGHGLGKANLAAAEGLAKRGHDVTLFAAPGSSATVPIITYEDESRIPVNSGDFDVVLDGTHFHRLQARLQSPIVNLSHDREAPAGRCAVYGSRAHRIWHVRNNRATHGRVVYNGINLPAPLDEPRGSYVLYLATMFPAKNPFTAWNACRLAGARLVMAGPTPPAPPPGVEYVGPVSGIDKRRLLAGAMALIYPSAIECSPLTVLEAQAEGTPVIVSRFGGSFEMMRPTLTGFACTDTIELAEAIRKIRDGALPDASKQARAFIATERNINQFVIGIEQALTDAHAGQVW